MTSARGPSEIVLAGHPCDVYEPARPSPQHFVILYLHDSDGGRLADRPALIAELERHGLPMIAPRSGRSWWTDKIWPDFDEQISAERYVIDRVIPYISERWNAQPPAIGLLGIGMGGQGAMRLAMKYPRSLPVAAAIAPAIDYYQCWRTEPALSAIYPEAEAARQDTATLHIHPLNWPRNLWYACDPADPWWANGADKLRMKLSALGIPYQCDLETSTGGDAEKYVARQTPAAIGYLVERLEAESRRVV